MGEDLARAFVSFFVIIDPVGNLVVFHLMTGHMAARQQVSVAAIAVLAAGLMLTLFALVGSDVLDFLNISEAGFRVAAGVLLLIPAYRMVSQGMFFEPAAEATPAPIDIALVPFATPLMAGPGALASATSLADELGTAETIAGFSLVLMVSFAAYVGSHRLFGLLGASTFRLLTRLVGILLVAIAIDLVISGLQESFPGLTSLTPRTRDVVCYAEHAMTVRTRYAPSPTGSPHLGNIRTALYDWLLARHHGGKFALRIEDTDQQRYVEGGVEAQMETLRWLGLDWDEGPDVGGPFGPYVQSQRLDMYQEHAQRLIDEGWAYQCYCSSERLDEVRLAQQARKEPPRYDRHCRDLTPMERTAKEAEGIPPVVRFKTPLDGETVAHDVLRGDVSFQNSTLDDFVILKSDGYPTYHLAAIVDDHYMETTHVLRGEEWLPSAPRHFLIYQAFGWKPPLFAHVSRILGADKAKLSKRHGAHAVLEYRELGYLPDALVNFLALLGWSLDDHTEIMTREVLVANFDVDRLLPNPAVFNAEKLLWMNGMYIREVLTDDELTQAVRPFLEKAVGPVDVEKLRRIVPLVKERIKLLTEIVDIADFFFTDGPLEYDVAALLGKKFADNRRAGAEALDKATAAIEAATDWKHETLEAAVRPLADELGVKAGELFGVIRVAVTGKTATPPLFETMEVLGRDVTLDRLRAAQDRLAAATR